MGNILPWTSSTEPDFPLKIRTKSKYGWIPDIPDQRDVWAFFPNSIQMSESIDLRNKFMPDVYDQGHLGSCTANALAGAFEFDQKKQSLESFMPSRLFLYYNERVIEGSTNYDSGASIRDGIKVLNKIGICKEEEYPYVIESFTIKPTPNAFIEAANHKTTSYRKVRPTVEEMCKSLCAGIPVIFGFSVYESFESPDLARTGIMPVPMFNEKIIGGHAVLAVGFDNSKKYMLVRNSWGSTWGQKGYFWMPFSFITPKNCSDMWVIEQVKDSYRNTVNSPRSTPAPVSASASRPAPVSAPASRPAPVSTPIPVVQIIKESYEFKDDKEDNEDTEDDSDENIDN